MRFGKFESAEQIPFEDDEKERKKFIDPRNERRIISETRESAEKESHRQLKGRFYLTKIAHLLLPDNVPEIHQVGESVDGEQTVDTERISNTLLEEYIQARKSGEDKKVADIEETVVAAGEEAGVLDSEFTRIGFGFAVDVEVSDYRMDQAGNVLHLDTFESWHVDFINPRELDLSFDEEELRAAIDDIPDEGTKGTCIKHLERLLTLFEEDNQERKEKYEASLVECGPHIEEFETLLNSFEQTYSTEALYAISSKEEALDSEERGSAIEDLKPIVSVLKFIKDQTDITDEEHDKLQKKYKHLSNAVGFINSGVVDHDR